MSCILFNINISFHLYNSEINLLKKNCAYLDVRYCKLKTIISVYLTVKKKTATYK